MQRDELITLIPCDPGRRQSAAGGRAAAAVVASLLLLCVVGACGDDTVIADSAKSVGDAVAESCSPSSCKGCCAGNTCRDGKSNDACGTGGLPCIACPAGNSCNGQNCIGSAAKCTTANCKGCCSGNICLTGDTDVACGTGGKACQSCGGKGCDKGSCKGNSKSCGSCSGCCDGTSCQPGTSDSACGTKGADCVKCASGTSCTSGSCTSPSCGPGSCSGCCSGGSCEGGTTATACGSSGASCKSCSSGEICSSGSCKLDPSSKWTITIVSAELDTSKSWDTWPANGKPDAYIKSKVGSTSLKDTTVKGNTYTPSWNEKVGTVTAGALLQNTLDVEVRDNDPIGSELIGGCRIQVLAAVIQAGAGVVNSCGSYVKKLTFSFARQ